MRKLALAVSFGLCHGFGKHALMNVTFPLILRASDHCSRGCFNVSTVVSVKRYFRWNLWCFTAMFAVRKIGYSLTRCQDISNRICGNKTGDFKPKCDLFLNLTKCYFVPKPNQTISTAMSQHEIEYWTKRNTTLQQSVHYQHFILRLAWTAVSSCRPLTQSQRGGNEQCANGN